MKLLYFLRLAVHKEQVILQYLFIGVKMKMHLVIAVDTNDVHLVVRADIGLSDAPADHAAAVPVDLPIAA